MLVRMGQTPCLKAHQFSSLVSALKFATTPSGARLTFELAKHDGLVTACSGEH